MATRKKAPVPRELKNPLSDAHVAQFDVYVEKWKDLLNMNDWRFVREEKRSSHMAEVTSIEHEHKLVKYRVGRNFGQTPVSAATLEDTALHEVFHVFFAPLIDEVIAYRGENAYTMEKEHAAMIVLIRLLMAAYASKAA